MGNMSVVALAVSSGCHRAGAAFKSTLFGKRGSAALLLRHPGRYGGRRNKETWGFCCEKTFRLTGASTGGCVSSWCGRGVSKPRLLGNGLLRCDGGSGGTLHSSFYNRPAVPGILASASARTFGLTLWKAGDLGRHRKGWLEGCNGVREHSHDSFGGRTNLPLTPENKVAHMEWTWQDHETNFKNM